MAGMRAGVGRVFDFVACLLACVWCDSFGLACGF